MITQIVIHLIILGILGWSLVMGYRRGGVVTLAEIGALVISTAVALLLARPVGAFIGRVPLLRPYSYFAALLALWVVAQLACFVPLWPLIKRLGAGRTESRFSRVFGAIANTLKSLALIWLFLVCFPLLPFSAALKSSLDSSFLPHQLLSVTAPLVQPVTRVLDQQLSDALGFLTVRSTDSEVIVLGFKYPNGQFDALAEQQLLTLLNADRTKNGLKTLASSDQLRTIARAHSQDMLARGYFSHVTPEGLDPFQRLRDAHFSFLAAGENLALAPTVQQAHDGLMNSPKHRDNILSPDFGRVGIGIVSAGENGYMATQLFTD